MTTHSIQKVIADNFESLSPELQRAARWVSRHGSSLALHSMRDSARAAEVTPATMTRLARRLGFDGFDGLRAPFRSELAGSAIGGEFSRTARRRRGSSAVADAVELLNMLQQANVASVISLNPAGAIDDAAQALLDAEQVHFLGLRVCHGVATYLSYAYGLLGDNGSLVTGIGGTLSDQVARVGPRSVLLAISQSPYTRQTVEAVQQAGKAGATVIAMTDSRLSPLARHASQVLLYDTASTAHFHSTAGAQALAESLIAAVAARGGTAATLHLRRMQAHLQKTRAYWERPGDKE